MSRLPVLPFDPAQALRWSGAWDPWVAATGVELPHRSRLLCAGLGAMAQDLLPLDSPWAEAAGMAGAGLSLLTKVDDQLIDRIERVAGRCAAQVQADTRALLAPTLAALLDPQAPAPEPRAALAAELGRQLLALGVDAARLRRVQDFVAEGWALQARALAVMSRPPGEADPAAVWDATAEVGMTWLLGVALPGWLPAEAGAFPSAGELAGLRAWGLAIQAADALCDQDRDRADGLVSTLAAVEEDHARLAGLRPSRPLLPRWPRLEDRFGRIHDLLVNRWRLRCSAC